MNVYCRFESDVSGAVVDGIRMDDATISCISPPRNGASLAIIPYAVFIEGCVYDANEVVWNAIDNDFIYDSDLAGVFYYPCLILITQATIIHAFSFQKDSIRKNGVLKPCFYQRWQIMQIYQV